MPGFAAWKIGIWNLSGIWMLEFGISGFFGPSHALGSPHYFDPYSNSAMLALMNTREMTDKFQDWQQRATETARNMGRATDEYVRENTWTTIAIAAMLGCLVGFLLANRND
jgi:hypothetical protein